MKIVIIGLGSMGKRRIRLIRELYPKYRLFGIDSNAERRDSTSKQFGIECFSSLESFNETVTCAFVCTSPLSHSAIISACLNRGWHVFTELNLVNSGYDENISLAKKNNCKLFLSSTFLYREEIRHIKAYIDDGKQWNYIYHVGQYLPNWHPWENYKDFFVSDKRTNGCREIMAIEFPWLIDSFGDIEEIQSSSDKLTDLSIDYNDSFFIQVKHRNNNKGFIVIDVVSPIAVRHFEAYTENSYIIWKGVPDSLYEYNKETNTLEKVELIESSEHENGYSEFIVENAYKNEIKEFFDVVLNDKQSIYGFDQDKNVLSIIDSLGA